MIGEDHRDRWIWFFDLLDHLVHRRLNGFEIHDAVSLRQEFRQIYVAIALHRTGFPPEMENDGRAPTKNEQRIKENPKSLKIKESAKSTANATNKRGDVPFVNECERISMK